MKHEEAVYKSSSGEYEPIKLEEIIELVTKNIKKFNQIYQGNLYCQECKLARLMYNNSLKTPYLSTYPNDKHSSTCSRRCNEVSATAFNSYCENKDNLEHIHQRLESLLAKLLRNKSTASNPLIILVKNKQCIEDTICSSGSARTYAIPTKSLTAPFSSEDYNIYKMFYGKVKIKWQENNKGNYFLKIINVDTHKLICSIAMSAYVHSKIPAQFQKDIEQALVVFNSKMELKDGKYNNSYFDDASRIVIENV